MTSMNYSRCSRILVFQMLLAGFVFVPAGWSQSSLEPSSPALRAVDLPDLSLDANLAAAQPNRDYLVARLSNLGASSPLLEAELYGELGILHHGLGLLEVAAVCYDNAHLLSPSDSRWSYLVALLAIGGKKYDRAREQLARILVREPEMISALLRLAEVWARQGESKEAIRALEKARAAGGEAAIIDRLLAGINSGKVDLFGEEVEAWFRDPLMLAILERSQAEPLASLEGRLAVRQGHFAEAAEAYSRLVAAQPDAIAPRLQLAGALAALGDVIRAFDQYSEVVRNHPDEVGARFNLGMLLAGQGALLSARFHLQQVVEIEPNHPDGHRELAHVLAKLGRDGDALVEFGAALSLDDRDVVAYLGAAKLLSRNEEYLKALQLLEAGLEISPEDVGLRHALARLLAVVPDTNLRDGARALQLAQSLLAENPSGEFAALAALALAESDRCDEAAEWLRRAIEDARAKQDFTRLADLEEILPRLASGTPCRLGEVRE